MGQSRQVLPTPAGFDPVKADWLPVLIYQSTQYTKRISGSATAPEGWQVASSLMYKYSTSAECAYYVFKAEASRFAAIYVLHVC